MAHHNTCSEFKEGYAVIGLKGRLYNLISERGVLLSKEWFQDAYVFNWGFARVKRYGKWNFIDKKGKFLLDEDYDELTDFKNGFAIVGREKGQYCYPSHEYNYIDLYGRFLSTEWFNACHAFREDGFGLVEIGYSSSDSRVSYKLIDKRGKLLTEFGSDETIQEFVNGFTVITKIERFGVKKYFFINEAGKVIGDRSYHEVKNFINGFACVCSWGEWNFINEKGEYLSESLWFDSCHNFNKEGYAKVSYNKVSYYIDRYGNLYSYNKSKILNPSDLKSKK